jgi:hypothetical protein
VPYSGEDGYPAERIRRFLLGPFFGGAIFLALLGLWLIFGSRLLNSPRRFVLYFLVLGLGRSPGSWSRSSGERYAAINEQRGESLGTR